MSDKSRTGEANSNFIHGLSHCIEYNSWYHMKSRCYNQADAAFYRYGARGIGICQRWLGENGFPNFLKDMGRRPTADHTLERKNNDRDYCPDNCRWATMAEQVSNRGNTWYIMVHGIKMTLAAASRLSPYKYHAFAGRIRRGQNPNDLVPAASVSKSTPQPIKG